ncbi:DNA polymerase III subunit alpha [Enterococcus saccharolyticus]|uniref:DNA polymerase III subunit alpha n=1 Tax=Candidatus Enterococcus willemsii TaxID=1857215 RepID=A0ABQ6YYV8_9ENTE|nr:MULTISPECIES: DNA polymerase III subunit alpha [Enterococcus]KAF1303329.1 DNA polymerase III subunit alpha [Enterococcus sp. CU12B]MCD5001700.1 DNA polymerase III subunit alpha [Enterococcus saccharolyticus]
MNATQLTAVTSYSLLQSTIQIPQYVQQAKQLGYQQLGITDVNNLHGALEFFQSCQKEGVKPLIGLLLTYQSVITEQEHELFFFAKNLSGYQLLMKLSSQKMITGTIEITNFASSDVYIILPEQSEVHTLLMEDSKLGEEKIQQWQQLFGKENIFYGVGYQQNVAAKVQDWMQHHEVRPVAYQLIDTLHEEETFAVNVLHHIKNGTQITDLREELQQVSKNRYLVSADEQYQWFQTNYPEAWEQKEMLAAHCQVEIPTHQTLLPHYPLEKQSAQTFLQELCLRLLPERVPNYTQAYQERLLYELSVIHKMGFDDYFLIVWDVMAFAHRQQIVTGAGRGSAAGSLVAYVLSITDVDPIEYNLLFERFLNPERYTMPDIDLDIPDNRREEVLLYVKEKYGQEHVAQIATFGTMAAKMVLRDVSRVFGLSQSEANRWSKAVPNALKMTLAKAYEESKALRELASLNERNHQLFQVAKILEGLPRHVSTHAAGIVISDEKLSDVVPLQAGSEEIWLTQFTMNDVETTGLLKMDFLGLRNLSIIDDTLQGIRQVLKQTIIQKEIPLDDDETLRLFQQGETAGVFQFESAGIRNVLRRLHPESIEDIAAVNALYRPGPMQNIDTFIRRKQGKEAITYLDTRLEPILANTYGIIVYQEQIMQIASQIAGFTLGQADMLRRAISKKNKGILDEERRHFVTGSIKNGLTETKANELYNYIERFADYGFNRSHAFAYSFVGFQMAYLKVHYPAPFYKALLQSVRQNPTKVKEYMNEARKRKIKLLPPSINRSGYGFWLSAVDEIRFGLSTVKGVRRDFLKDILEERKENGAYRSVDQFLSRLAQRNSKWLKEELIRPLIDVGAFDEIITNRRQTVTNLDGKIQNVLYSGGSMDLLEVMTLKEQETAEYTLEEKLGLEEELLGVYLSGHPVEQFTKVRQWKKVQEVATVIPNQSTKLLLYIKNIREIRTKKGEQMAFIEGDDTSGEISVTVFPTVYRQIRHKLAGNRVILVEGKVETSNYNGELQVLAHKIELADQLEQQIANETCYLRINEQADEQAILAQFSQVLRTYSGNVPILLFFEKNHRKQLVDEKNWIVHTSASEEQLKAIFGEKNVIFK